MCVEIKVSIVKDKMIGINSAFKAEVHASFMFEKFIHGER